MQTTPTVPLIACLFALCSGPVHALTADEVNQASVTERRPTSQPDPAVVKAQVLLSRRSISPGEIDGVDGENYRKAIAQFRRQENLGEGEKVDERTWRALGADTASNITTEYILSERDVSSRFVRRIPRDYAKQAALKRLSYTGAPEMFAERFHMSEALLRALNPHADFRTAGERISVVSVNRQPFEAPVERIEAVKKTGMLVVFGPGDAILASYPATIGSGDTPSPEGEYRIERIVRNPTYHYDPEKNFQQGSNKRKLTLPPGPNNPVGTVWIALSKPTFGIHGTPEPSQVSKTTSHGCVRLTNWDAQELAGMVKPGLAVRFVD
ncbi:L,D-transpeptidase family protein [Starkeya sp. ORNL1]|uniref:L,D-transpeptidase n=1 Tax=Starkeya sp. ORNL1 TaxID=2709380 RepID=UPI0032B121E5